MLKVRTGSPEETLALGAALGQLLRPGDLLCLSGDLGAGKTAFAQGVARGLGVEGPVTSPTFIIVNEYEGRLPFYHFDVYRLDDPEEITLLGFDDYLEGNGVTLIEWAERIERALPEERLGIKIERDGETGRVFTFDARGSRYTRLVEELSRIARPGN
ncbi:MAG: tRNA (adenosine(37)-N6)-threonylcarbamoyltransferase complex ATPase subunit type 1 TsaE [Bacillota bacterium]|nr:tRNA (adenosine(37)-N6)-threonylcarbamoyltransferase complex ATPase subunit type 1 TsaE [Bacillota bacterium]